jgi:hypothetical protein
MRGASGELNGVFGWQKGVEVGVPLGYLGLTQDRWPSVGQHWILVKGLATVLR